MRKRILLTFCLLETICMVSCNNEKEMKLRTDFPISLTASYAGLSRVSSENMWEGNGTEQITVSDGENHATYAIINQTGDMQPVNENNQLYWASATNPQILTAWYPATENNESYTSWNVQKDQSSNGFQQSDLMYACTEVTMLGNHTLPFKHQTAKIIIHLQGDGETDDELKDATIKIKNVITEGSIEDGILTAKEHTSTSEIIPQKQPVPLAGYLISYAALLVPQEITGIDFLEIQTSGGNTYTYVPEDGDALFEGSQQYIYYVTVGEPGISVVIEKDGLQWQQKGEDIIVNMTSNK